MNKCEPLRGKKHDLEAGSNILSGIIVFDKDDVKSAVGFYKKYKDHNLMEFKDDFYKEYKEFLSQLSKTPSWNDWLFDYCFGDVIDEK